MAKKTPKTDHLKATQFKKGEAPGGKPGRTWVNTATYLKQMMDSPLEEVFSGEQLKGASPAVRKKVMGQILMEQLSGMAMGSDMDGVAPAKKKALQIKAMNLMMDRVEGFAVQTVKVDDVTPHKVDEAERKKHHESILARYVEKKFGVKLIQEKTK